MSIKRGYEGMSNTALTALIAILLVAVIVLGFVLKAMLDSQDALTTDNLRLGQEISQLSNEIHTIRNAAPAAGTAAPATAAPTSTAPAVSTASLVNRDVGVLTLGDTYAIEWQAPASAATIYISVSDGQKTYRIDQVPNIQAAEAAPSSDGTVRGAYTWDVGSTADGTALGAGDGFTILISTKGFDVPPDDQTNPFSLSNGG